MWLPREPAPDDLSALAPWQPLGADCSGLAYVVVDELHDGIAGLVVSPWPRVDEHGRLRFGREADSTRVAMSAAELRALLNRHREPIVEGGLDDAQRRALRTRRVQIGDVFAARFDGALGPPVLDVTAPAREAAKAQTSAALSGAMSAEYLEVVAEEMREDAGE